MIEAGQREGVLDDEKRWMLQRILRFRNRTAKETMVPRPDVVAAETKDVDEILTELCDQRRNMVIVVDEFGTTAGILTIEDIVEEGETVTYDDVRLIVETAEHDRVLEVRVEQ